MSKDANKPPNKSTWDKYYAEQSHLLAEIDAFNPPLPRSVVEVDSSTCTADVLRSKAGELGYRPEEIPPAQPSVMFEVDSRVVTYCEAVCKTKTKARDYRDDFQYVYPADRYK
jgi:hypothetical protein